MSNSKKRRLPWGWGPLLVAVLVTAVFVTMGLYQVWHQHRVLELGHELSRQSDVHTELREQGRKLKLELSAIKRSEAVREVAEERFDMKIPDQRDYIVVTK